jgi:hypothetical protein
MTAKVPDRFETVAWVYSQTELAVLLSLFEHEDILVMPISRGHVSVQWTWTVALGGVELRVHETDGARARALLAEIPNVHVWRGFLLRDRVLDIALIVLMFFMFALAPPARIQAGFVGVAARREN